MERVAGPMSDTANPAAPPVPKSPKPGEGWVPTADGNGWLPPDQAGSPAAWQPPGGGAPAPAGAPDPAKIPERIAGPVIDDPSYAPPAGPATPVPGSTPSTGDPKRELPPDLGPITIGDEGGPAMHHPGRTTHPWEPQVGPESIDPASGSFGAGAGADLYRDMLIKQMGQDEIPNVNDAAIKAQLDPYRAEQTRAMRDEIRSGAEQAFAGQQDYGSPEQVAAAERAGQNTGLRASDLVGRELTARRQQISDALEKYGSQLNADQNRALTAKLAQIDATLKSRGLDIQESLGQRGLDLNAQELALKKYLGDKDIGIQLSDQDIRRLGLTQTGQLGNRELDIRDKLGQMGINADMIRALLADQQFRETLGLNIGTAVADQNRRAVIDGMNGA